MRHGVLSNFRFSPVATLLGIFIAALMLRASAWQWSRYKEKVKLLESYATNAGSPPLPFPDEGPDISAVLNRKVAVEGDYDFERQMIVLNRRHITGPGFWLLTPLRLSSGKAVIVSRGFIPFADGGPDKWAKYNAQPHVRLEAVAQKTVPGGFLGPASAHHDGDGAFIRRWYYADIERIAAQLPYPAYSSVYLQRLEPGPKVGPNGGFTFPAEAVSVGVPPTTHFGYTIEWVLLALGTLALSFAWQAFPWFFRRPARPDEFGIQRTHMDV